MATNLKDLIDSLNGNDIPTNIFTIEDEDPNVILGKLNEVIAYLGSLQATINASDIKASEALTNANEALRQCIESVKYSEEAFLKATSAEEKAEKAVEATKVLESLVPRVEEALSHLDEINAKMSVVEEKANNAITASSEANTTANNAITNANEAVTKAEQAIVENTTQDGKILSLETKNIEQDNSIATLSSELTKESEKRATEDSDIRDSINRIVAGESELNEEILNQLNELDAIKSDKTETNTHFANIDTDITNIKSHDTQQDKRLTAVESKNTSQDLDISNLKSRATNLETTTTNQGNSITSLQTSVAEIPKLNTALNTLNTTLTSHGNKLTELEENDMINDQTVAALATDLNTAKTDISSLKTAKTSMQTDISSLKTRATNIETKNTQQDTRLSAVENKATTNATEIATRFQIKPDLKSPFDANNLTETGIYFIRSTKGANVPLTNLGQIIVLKNEDSHIHQIYIGDQINIYMRTYLKSWSDWKEFSNDMTIKKTPSGSSTYYDFKIGGGDFLRITKQTSASGQVSYLPTFRYYDTLTKKYVNLLSFENGNPSFYNTQMVDWINSYNASDTPPKWFTLGKSDLIAQFFTQDVSGTQWVTLPKEMTRNDYIVVGFQQKINQADWDKTTLLSKETTRFQIANSAYKMKYNFIVIGK